MPYLFQKRGIRVIYKGSIFVQKSIAVNPQRICKCHRYIVLNGVSVILIQNQCRGHNANLFCQFPCGETLECPVILQILARCGAFFIGFVVKGQMNHDFAFRIEVNPCVIEITIGKVRKYLHLDELTPAILNDMIKAVYVHAPDKSKGYREQQIDISYDLVGILPASLLNDLQNGETA